MQVDCRAHSSLHQRAAKRQGSQMTRERERLEQQEGLEGGHLGRQEGQEVWPLKGETMRPQKEEQRCRADRGSGH